MGQKTNITLIMSLMISALLWVGSGCKNSWLDAPPDVTLEVPKTIDDFQALLDNTSQTFNLAQSSGLAEIAAGDFYLSQSGYATIFTNQEKSAYRWAATAEFYNGETSADWVSAYHRILNANVVLDGIAKIKPGQGEIQDWNRVKGSALFFRSFDFFNLAQEFCKPYIPSNADIDPGLPLRLAYDVNIRLQRSSLKQTYEQLLQDLKVSAGLLEEHPLVKTRPSKPAAFALLARAYLSMEQYTLAGLYADSALQISSTLVNYATLSRTAAFPLERFNPEVIFHSTFSYGIFAQSKLLTDPELYQSYSVADLRKQVFFKASATGFTYKGSYSGDKNLFGGLATDELYLIRAECSIRSGLLKKSLAALNTLLASRWDGTYPIPDTQDPEMVLELVLRERRKELVYRGIHWQDLRRLNRDPRFRVTLIRMVEGSTRQLSPQDPRYVFPIDEAEIALSGIVQNER